jgi:hypothetical protein
MAKEKQISNIEQGMMNDEVFIYFDIHNSLFNIRYLSLSCSRPPANSCNFYRSVCIGWPQLTSRGRPC